MYPSFSTVYDLLLNVIVSYYFSYIIIFTISFIMILIIIINNYDLISLVVIFYLIYDVIRYIKMLNNIMLRFYYERYKYHINFRKNKIIIGNNKRKMFKERNNYFVINDNYYSEYDILLKMFDK